MLPFNIMRKSAIIIAGCALVVIQAWGQEYTLFNDQRKDIADASREMVVLYGQILDASSNQPIKGHINFEKMPRANNVGYISNRENGAYQLHMLQNRKYTLEVTADGYVTIFDIVDIEDIDADGQIKRDYLLTRAVEGNVLRMNNLLFELGKSQILESSYDELNSLAQMLHNNTRMKIQLEGHTDFRGNPQRNMKLSEDRVLAVREYLISQDIKKNRIKWKSFGGSQPLTTDKSENAKMRNRRVEVRILSNR